MSTIVRTETLRSTILGYDHETRTWVRGDLTIELTVDLDRLFQDVADAVSRNGSATRARGAIVAKRVKPLVHIRSSKDC